MRATTMADLKRAAKQGEAEVLVTDAKLARLVSLLEAVRRTANILVFVILAVGIFIWANPMNWDFLGSNSMQLVRRILLAVGIILLFSDYVLPVVRRYKVAGRDENGLRLVSRRPRKKV